MSFTDLGNYFDSNDWEMEAERFYSVLMESLRDNLRVMESGIDATVEPPNVCVFVPAELFEDQLKGDFESIDSVSDAEVFAGMSIFMGAYFDDLVDEQVHRACKSFLEERVEDHKLAKIGAHFYRLEAADKDYDVYYDAAGRFFPEANYFALNYFLGKEMPDNVPEFLLPVRQFLEIESLDRIQNTVVHEMTHAYIENKSKHRKRTRHVADLNEAAAQAVSSVLDEGSVPSRKYYQNDVDQDVMQAARRVFLESVEGMDKLEAVSHIRREAVKAIDKVVDGEDPVKALRGKNDRRAKIVRIASYATKRMADDVVRDIAVVGITRPYEKFADQEQMRDRTREMTGLWGDLKKVDKIGKKLHALAYSGEVKKELREPTEELSENARKIFRLIRKDYEDEIEGDLSFIEDIFGESWRTDPAVYDEDELVSYMDGILYRYKNLIDEAVSRAEDLERATEKIHEEGEKLVDKYGNREAAENTRELIKETEKLHEEIDEVRQNLEEAEKMAETGLSKIEKLEEN